MMILAIILGLMDLLGGIIIITGGFYSYAESGFILTLGAAFPIKGILLFLYARFGEKPHYDWYAAVDMIAGILLVSMYFNAYNFLFTLVAIVLILKGIIGLVKGMV